MREKIGEGLTVAAGLAFWGWLGYAYFTAPSAPPAPPKPACMQRSETSAEITAQLDDPGKTRCYMWEGVNGNYIEGAGEVGEDVGSWVSGYLSHNPTRLNQDQIDAAIGHYCHANPCASVRQAADSIIR